MQRSSNIGKTCGRVALLATGWSRSHETAPPFSNSTTTTSRFHSLSSDINPISLHSDMGFIKRILTGKFKRKKEPKIYVPEFNATSYAGYSLPRPSQDQNRLSVKEDEFQNKPKSASTSRMRKASRRAPSTAPSVAATTHLEVTSDLESLMPPSLSRAPSGKPVYLYIYPAGSRAPYRSAFHSKSSIHLRATSKP